MRVKRGPLNSSLRGGGALRALCSAREYGNSVFPCEPTRQRKLSSPSRGREGRYRGGWGAEKEKFLGGR